MRNGKDKNSCLFGDELVSYIYDELTPASRKAFEDHLLDCGGCTAEFADISISRLGVYEWHRDDFLPLQTPYFAIPFETPKAKVSWFDAIRGLVASPMRLGFAGASLAITIFGFVVVSNFGTKENAVANGVGSGPTAPVVLPVLTTESKPSTVKSASIQEPEVKPVREFRNVQPVRQTRVVHTKANLPKQRVTTETTRATSAPPRLANFVDTEDKSLRLADLVADIDTRD